MARRLVPALLVSLLASWPAFAANEFRMIHAGRLLDGGDLPVAGSHKLSFRLYEVSSEEGVEPVWEAEYTVEVKGGYYAVELGDPANGQDPLTGAIFAGPRWLGISVDSGAELSPRLRIGGVPQAANAMAVNGIEAATTPSAGKLVPLGADAKFGDELIASSATWNAKLATVKASAPFAGTGTQSAPLELPKATATQDGYLAAATLAALQEGLAAKVEANEVVTVPAPGKILRLDAQGRIPLAALPGGAAGGLDADTLDGISSAGFARIDADGRLPVGTLPANVDAATVDGLDSAAFAQGTVNLHTNSRFLRTLSGTSATAQPMSYPDNYTVVPVWLAALETFPVLGSPAPATAEDAVRGELRTLLGIAPGSFHRGLEFNVLHLKTIGRPTGGPPKPWYFYTSIPVAGRARCSAYVKVVNGAFNHHLFGALGVGTSTRAASWTRVEKVVQSYDVIWDEHRFDTTALAEGSPADYYWALPICVPLDGLPQSMSERGLGTATFTATLTNRDDFTTPATGTALLKYTNVRQNSDASVLEMRADGTLLVKKAGAISLHANVDVKVNAPSPYATMIVQLNGSLITRTLAPKLVDTWTQLSATVHYTVAAGDVLSVASSPSTIDEMDNGDWSTLTVLWTGVR